MSTISAGTSSGTALVSTGDTTGALVLQTNGTTTAVTIGTNQVVTLAQPLPVASGGTGGSATPTAGGIVYGTGTAQAVSAAGSAGQVLQSNGVAAPTWVAVASGLSAATQAEMEAATSNTVAATPLNTNWHPSVAKAWLKANGAGTAVNASRNITSITDTGAGRLTVTIDIDFSSANYVINTTAQTSGNDPTTIGALTTAAAQAAGSVELRAYRFRFDNQAVELFDPESYYMTCYGDQA
jgi:hypothetical protein